MSDYESSRHFAEFLAPALAGLPPEAVSRVALALDVAIAFGALEHANGNPSLRVADEVAAGYAEKLARLKALAAVVPAPVVGPALPPLFAALEAELVQQVGAEAFDEMKRTIVRHCDELVQSLMSIAPKAPTVN